MQRRFAAIVAALLLAVSVAACTPGKALDSGAPVPGAPILESSGTVTVEPSLEAFKKDCLDYAKKAFDVEPGKDGINEDNILLTVAPALAGYWRVDIQDSPSDEQYIAFMTAFEQSEYWNHDWDDIDSELTYEQSAEVLARLMDFCYEAAVKSGWTPGDLPVPAAIPQPKDDSSSAGEGTPDASSKSGNE